MTFVHPKRALMHLKMEPGMQVADLGAGAGHFTFEASRLVGGGGTVFAIEVQKKLVEKIKNEAKTKHLTNIKALWGDLEERIHIEDKAVNIAILANVLFQLEDKRGVVEEAHRILKSNGKLLVIDWSESYGGMGPHHGHVVEAAEAKRLVKEAGFSHIEDVPAGAHHYGFIAKKT